MSIIVNIIILFIALVIAKKQIMKILLWMTNKSK